MSKNTRWALAIVGVVILAVAAFVIGSSKDDTKAVQTPAEQPTPKTAATPSTGASSATGATGGQNGGSGTNGSGSGSGDNTGGAAPRETPGDNTGGASPQNDTGGAKAQIGVVGPVLSPSNVRTIVAKKGQTVVIRGRSSVAAEMHLHGYDKEIQLKPNVVGQIKMRATIDGEFAIEFHLGGSEAQVGTLRVNP